MTNECSTGPSGSVLSNLSSLLTVALRSRTLLIALLSVAGHPTLQSLLAPTVALLNAQPPPCFSLAERSFPPLVRATHPFIPSTGVIALAAADTALRSVGRWGVAFRDYMQSMIMPFASLPPPPILNMATASLWTCPLLIDDFTWDV